MKAWAQTATMVAAAVVLLSVGTERTMAAEQGLDLVSTMARAGERVEAFFRRAQSIVCNETVSILPLGPGLTSLAGFGRTVESELRLWWDEAAREVVDAVAQTRRNVLKVNRRTPRKNDPNNCTVQEQNEAETQPLSMLLPSERDDYTFRHAGRTRVDGRRAIMIDYRQTTPVKVDVSVMPENDECVGIELNGGMRGRLWMDEETLDVLRLDQQLAGLVDVRMPPAVAKRPGGTPYWTLERWDTSIRFRTVHFDDPEETLILPVSSTTVRVTRTSGIHRTRTETKYANYQRFLTGARVIEQ